MDPITQGALGAQAGQLVSNAYEKRVAAVFALAGGMAPDLDVLIRSSHDPILALEYHRQFTHALVFIPVGALICAGFLYALARLLRRNFSLSFAKSYLFCLAGYATHALLDACTTYGTLLLWPFSDMRVAWNTVSVVDPLFTLPLLAILILSIVRRSQTFAVLGFVYVFAYLGLGKIQHDRAQEFAYTQMQARGHGQATPGVKPSFANLLVWKNVYQFEGRYYIDAVRVGLDSRFYPGLSVEVLDVDKHFPWLDADSQQARDIERFRWFSNDFLALDPRDNQRIIDVRYSLIPNEASGMWGISLSPDADKQAHVGWFSDRPIGAALKPKIDQLWQMITNAD